MNAHTVRTVPGISSGIRFPVGTICQARGGIVPLHVRAAAHSERDTEVLFGECVTVLSYRRGWMRVRAHLDGKEGFVDPAEFSRPVFSPTHRVCVPSVWTSAFRPVQSADHTMLGMNALVRVVSTPDEFSELRFCGWINHSCLMPIGEFDQDFVEVASRFVSTPYKWGARTGFAIDCSALLQTALMACGMKGVPRDSTPQSRTLGVPVKARRRLRRGDLVFWRGHVGIMVSPTRILHATGDTMRVLIEPLQRVIERRILKQPEDKKHITVVRRIPEYTYYRRRG